MFFLLQVTTQQLAVEAAKSNPMGLSDIAVIFSTVLGALAAFWAGLVYILKPKFREMVQETISSGIGKQIEEVPRLVFALEKLTMAIEHQNQDTIKLDNTIKSLDSKVDKIANEVYDISGRTASLEGRFQAFHPQ